MSEQLRPTPRLAIVVPCYNEEEVFPYCLLELKKLLGGMVEDGLIRPDSFLLFVNDGSRDTTWEQITEAALLQSWCPCLKPLSVLVWSTADERFQGTTFPG